MLVQVIDKDIETMIKGMRAALDIKKTENACKQGGIAAVLLSYMWCQSYAWLRLRLYYGGYTPQWWYHSGTD